MKRTLALVLALFLAAGIVGAAPKSSGMGIGLFLGQPTGIDLGIDMSRTQWLDFKAAWDFAGNGGSGYSIILQGNWEMAFPGTWVIEGEDIVPFLGVGAQANVNDAGINVGIHVPFGIDYRFKKVPLELFLEIGLDVYLFPATDFSGSGGLGLRFRL